jgi:hypothetical protein
MDNNHRDSDSPWIRNFKQIVREHQEREGQRLAEIGRLPPVFKVAFPAPCKQDRDLSGSVTDRTLLRTFLDKTYRKR